MTATTGYLYNPERSVKDDAANIRRHIKTMTKAGLLPADWRYSVRYRTASMYQAVDITATAPRPIYGVDLAGLWDWQTLGIDPPVHAETGEPVTSSAAAWTREAKAVLDTLDELHAAHNYDDSDTMTDYFDVKFYGTVAITVTDGTPNHMTRETTS